MRTQWMGGKTFIPIEIINSKTKDKMTNNQQQIINSLISEFDTINKSKKVSNSDLLNFINTQLDEIAIKKEQFREQTRVAKIINKELIDRLTDDITNLLDNFGYKLEVIENSNGDCYYFNITFVGEFDCDKRTECKTYYAELYYESFENIKGVAKGGFRLTSKYRSSVSFTNNDALLKDIAEHIVQFKKREL